ncbi:15628_t:CDS:2 [Funneliformis geosporum]|nr:15628_t:CDS:2 [Funneliformis geosporum]
MFLGYKAKFEKDKITLQKNDHEHENKHKTNEQRIKSLEDKLTKKDQKYKELKGDIRLIKALMTLDKERVLEEPAKESVENNTQYVEEQAVNYIQNVVLPDLTQKEAEKGEVVAEGV